MGETRDMELIDIEDRVLGCELPECSDHCRRPKYMLQVCGVVIGLCDECLEELCANIDQVKGNTTSV